MLLLEVLKKALEFNFQISMALEKPLKRINFDESENSLNICSDRI